MSDRINRYFRKKEFDGHDKDNTPAPYIDEQLVEILTDIREFFGVPLYINDSYRTPEHNKEVGGVPNSYHLYDKPPHAAADIRVKGTRPEEVHAYINAKYPDTLGLGLYKTFCHVDTRVKKARWNDA